MGIHPPAQARKAELIAFAIAEHDNVEDQRQRCAWLLPILDGPEDERAVDRLAWIRPLRRQLRAPLPAGGHAARKGQQALPAIKTGGFTQRQPSHHPGEQKPMALVNE